MWFQKIYWSYFSVIAFRGPPRGEIITARQWPATKQPVFDYPGPLASEWFIHDPNWGLTLFRTTQRISKAFACFTLSAPRLQRDLTARKPSGTTLVKINSSSLVSGSNSILRFVVIPAKVMAVNFTVRKRTGIDGEPSDSWKSNVTHNAKDDNTPLYGLVAVDLWQVRRNLNQNFSNNIYTGSTTNNGQRVGMKSLEQNMKIELNIFCREKTYRVSHFNFFFVITRVPFNPLSQVGKHELKTIEFILREIL